MGNIQIGGRNLLLDTKEFTEKWSGVVGIKQEEKYLGLTVYYGSNGNIRSMPLGKDAPSLLYEQEYTLSFYAKGDGVLYTNVINPNLVITATNGAPECIGKPYGMYHLSSEWKRYFITFRGTGGGNDVYTFPFAFYIPNGTAYICGAKLEYGNVPTDWSPAPEDSDSGLQFIRQIFPDGVVKNAATVSQLLAVRDENENIVAGIYGGGVKELEEEYGFRTEYYGKLMIFAGADGISKKEKVEAAGTRIYADGTIVTNKLEADKAQIKNSTLKDVTISGTIKSPFQEYFGVGHIEIGGWGDDINKQIFEKYDNFSCQGDPDLDSKTYELAWDSTQNGRTITLTNYHDGEYIGAIKINAKGDNTYFFENGKQSRRLDIYQECVVLKGFGEGDTFYGWIVLSRTKMPGYVEPQTGFQLKPRRIVKSGTISNTDRVLFVTADVTLTLPSDPEDGQMYFIKNITGPARTTLKPGSSDHFINDGRFSTKSSWSWSEGCFVMLVWDAENKIWQAGYTNNN